MLSVAPYPPGRLPNSLYLNGYFDRRQRAGRLHNLAPGGAWLNGRTHNGNLSVARHVSGETVLIRCGGDRYLGSDLPLAGREVQGPAN